MSERKTVTAREHWTRKGEVRLYLYEKFVGDPKEARGTILFVHGSSMAGRPTFDLQVPGRPHSSAMDWFAERGFDTWSVDMEGYGRSDKQRDINCDIANGADDLAAAADCIEKTRGAGPLLIYGISSGALRAALFAERCPERVKRLALDAFVWTGDGSPTLAERRKKLPAFLARNRRPLDRAFVHSIFTRDHPGTADSRVVDAFADAILALDSEVPTGTYVDMCTKLPLVEPTRILCPTLVMRGEFDGIAGFDDLIAFFAKLPNADKEFAVMPGIAHASFQEKNYLSVYDILYGFFSRTPPAYRGG
ncbi:MAG TPA: alpha/beta fold hydrolase [Alphaproteobacteria bacterium]|nr:alpha/beta fold hydrolase [Alphaproteobacteria bacterium]